MRWFKHMTASHSDEKLAAFLSDNGLEGYGFWWLLMEIVAFQCNDDKCSATYSLPHWSRMLYCHHHKVSKYLGKLGVTGIVTVEYELSSIKVTIPNLLKYRDEYSRKSGQKAEVVPPKKQNQSTETEAKEELKTLAVPVKPSRPRTPKLSDEDWLKQIKENPAYEGIDIDRLIGKCQAWCLTKQKQVTRARILNWLNREEKPMTGIAPTATKLNTFAQQKLENSFQGSMDFVEDAPDGRHQRQPNQICLIDA